MIEWFDDLKLGMRFESGETMVSREDIKRFASEFDPQPFHLDEAAAENSVLQGLAASGWRVSRCVPVAAGSMTMIVPQSP
jgi:acyl dehydratase